jgi:hypothetical protein
VRLMSSLAFPATGRSSTASNDSSPGRQRWASPSWLQIWSMPIAVCQSSRPMPFVSSAAFVLASLGLPTRAWERLPSHVLAILPSLIYRDCTARGPAYDARLTRAMTSSETRHLRALLEAHERRSRQFHPQIRRRI